MTIGWDRFAAGMDGENQAELNEIFEEYEYEGTIEDFLRRGMAPVHADRFTVCGGDGGCNACGGMGPLMSYLPCSPHCKPEVRHRETR